MSKAGLKKAVELAEKVGYVFLATSNQQGIPHMAIVQPVGLDAQDHLKIVGWFCEYTMRNIYANPYLSILVWDSVQDEGYQLVGKVLDVEDIAILDGYFIREQDHPLPQIERKMFIRVDMILTFEKRPHVDMEI